MSQNEIARPGDLGLDDDDVSEFLTPTVRELIALGSGAKSARALADHMSRHAGAMYFGDPGLDETMGMVREQFFASRRRRSRLLRINGICATNSFRSMSSPR
jgi:(2S)-methylsuccinyl-CoA dehydrogenase